MSNTYYYIPSLSKRKYKTLESAQKTCSKSDKETFTIIKCTEEEIKYVNTKKQIYNSPEVIKCYIDKIKNVICDPLYDFENYEFNQFNDNIYYNIKYSKVEFNVFFKTFLIQLFEKYPIDKIEVGRLISNYKPCNGIYFYFTNIYDYGIKSNIKPNINNRLTLEYINEFKIDLNDLNLYPELLSIMIRYDNNKADIVFDVVPDVFGHNVKTKKREPIDLTLSNIQEYIDNGLNYIYKSKLSL